MSSLSSGMASENIQLQIAVAVMKQAQDQQELAGQALVSMINQASSIDGTGQIVNLAV
ncbi:MAG: putative motility protein [Chloroflexi bacterium]|nr:putative motility protein [Chloroflexota bacterium]